MLRRTIQLLCFTCLIAATSRAADEPFIGKWKLNLSKSKLADQMTIAPAGANRYTLTFAGAGETETLVADGTDQPGIQGSTISITVEAPGNWKIVRKNGGRTVLTANRKLSDDGKALTDTFIGNQPDGSTSRIDLVYKRARRAAQAAPASRALGKPPKKSPSQRMSLKSVRTRATAPLSSIPAARRRRT
jgi:hypothetical protein